VVLEPRHHKRHFPPDWKYEISCTKFLLQLDDQ
jgi:hypothetical protein